MWRCCSFHRSSAGINERGLSFSTVRTCACSACPTTRRPRPSPCSKTHRPRSSTPVRCAESTPNGSMGCPRFHPRTKSGFAAPSKSPIAAVIPSASSSPCGPLIAQGLLQSSAPLTINAVSGYSGGGKAMIAEYEGEGDHKPFCLYGLDGDHKHLPEIWKFSGCEKQPLFVPSVDHSFCGMVVSTPVPTELFARPRVNRQSRVRGLARVLQRLSLCEGGRAARRCVARRQVSRPNGG